MDLIAIGTTDNRVSILRYPSLEAVVPVIELKSELVDLNWGGKEGKWVGYFYHKLGMSWPIAGGHGHRLTLSIWAIRGEIGCTSDTNDLSTQYRYRTRQFPFCQVRLYTPGWAVPNTRFSPHPSAPTIHAVLNASKPSKRGGPRKAFVATFTLVAGPSKAPHTAEEDESSSVRGKEKEAEEELGRWDVVLRREVATKPVTVFDVRWADPP
jgi:prolactin regulatory element-binding protein